MDFRALVEQLLNVRVARRVALLLGALFAATVAAFGVATSPAQAAVDVAATGSISGTVKAPDGGRLSEDVFIDVYDKATGEWLAGDRVFTGQAVAVDDFTISGVPTNRDCAILITGDYPHQWYRLGGNTNHRAEATVVHAGDSIDATVATGAGEVKGTLVPPAGKTLGPGFSVELVNPDGDRVAYASVSAGQFAFAHLLADSYRLRITGYDDRYPLQWYRTDGDVPTRSGASTVAVGADSTTITVKLLGKSNGSIAGTVKQVGGALLDPRSSVDVRISNADGDSVGYLGEVSGSYQLGGLFPGTYTVSAVDGSAWEIYRSATFAPETVAAGATTTHNIELEPTEVIAGTIHAPGGAKLGSDTELRVAAYPTGATPGDYHETPIAVATDGKFEIHGLQSGTYRVRIADSSGTYPLQWYHEALNVATKTQAADVGATAIPTNLDVKLLTKGVSSISGSIVEQGKSGIDPEAELWVGVRNEDGDEVSHVQTKTASYAVRDLLPGTYRLDLHNGGEYPGEPIYHHLETAPFVINGPGEQNLTLLRAGSISGKVAPHEPLSQVRVYASTGPDGNGGSAQVRPDGTYTVYGLDTGTYDLAFSDINYMGSQGIYADAELSGIGVTDGSDSPGHDVTLTQTKAVIKGELVDAKGNPIPAYRVDMIARDREGKSLNGLDGASTNGGKFYLAVTPGVSVKDVLITTGYGYGYRDKTVPVNQTATTSAPVDLGVITLARQGYLTGTVAGPEGASLDESAWTYVNAFDANGTAVGTGGYVNADTGRFEIGNLSGIHVAKLEVGGDSFYARQDVSVDKVFADDDAVDVGVIQLAKAGSLNGRVTSSDVGIDRDASVSVTAFNGATAVAVGYVDSAAGTYRIGGLVDAHITKVVAHDSAGRYLDQVTEDLNLNVASGSDVEGPTIELARAGALIGEVVRSGGADLDSDAIRVDAFDGDSQVGYSYVSIDEGSASYEIRGLNNARITKLVAHDSWGNYQDTTVDTGANLTVPAGSDVTGPTIELTKNGVLTGKVTAPGGFVFDNTGSTRVTAYNGDQYVGSGYVASGGDEAASYRIGGLNGVHITKLVVRNYSGRYLDTTLDSLNLDVAAGSEVTGPDLELELAGAVAGKVTGPGGALDPTASIWVSAYDGDRYLASGSAASSGDQAGTYRIGGLNGDHVTKLVAHDSNGRYFDATVESLNLDVAAGSEVAGPDLVLAKAGMLTGDVTGPAGVALEWSWINVTAFNGTQQVGSYNLYAIGGDVDEPHEYRIGGLNGAHVTKLIAHDNSGHYLDKTLDNLDLTVPAGVDVAGPTIEMVRIGRVPGLPAKPSATAHDGRADLAWTGPTDVGDSSITDYAVEYSSDGGASWSVFNDGTATTTSTTVTGLVNGTGYRFRVSATNSAGTGNPSASSDAATPYAAKLRARLVDGDGQAVAPGTTVGVAAKFANLPDFVVWPAVSTLGADGRLEYLLTQRPDTTGLGLLTAVKLSADGFKPAVVEGLSIDVGTFTDHDFGTVTVVRPPTPPAAPVVPTGVSGDRQVALTWTAPNANGSLIEAYLVQAKAGAGGWTDVADTDGSAVDAQARISDLSNGTEYLFRVAAVNAAGQGPWSAASPPLKPFGKPTAPSALSAVATDGQAVLTWTAPLDDGGSPITRHQLQAKAGAGGWTDVADVDGSAVDAQARISGLSNGTEYLFRVAAVNAAGQSEWSGESAPVKPTGRQAITFTRPADVAFGAADVSLDAAASSGLPVGLTSETPGVCVVTDGKAKLLAIGSCEITATQGGNEAFNPAAPVSRSFTVTIGAALTPKFGAVTRANDGFTVPIDNYDGHWQWNAASGSGNAAVSDSGVVTVSNLTSGQSSTVTIVAKRANFTDGTADVTGAAIGAPSVPGALTATAGDMKADLSWSPPTETGGLVITDYKLQVKPASGGDWTDATDSDGHSTDLKATVTGLMNGTSYVFHVSAVNGAGTQGAWSGDSNQAKPMGGQTITFDQPADIGFEKGSVVLNPVAGSGLSVTLASGSLDVCTVSGATVSFLKVGTCTITARQPGDATRNPAADVTRTFQVKSAPARTPALGAATGTHGGFTVQITNYDSGWQWSAASSGGTASVSDSGLVTVVSLPSGQSASVTVSAKRANYTDGTANTTGTAITEAAPPVIADQHVAGGVPAKLKRNNRKPAKLPAATDGGQRVTWVSATPKICKVVKGKLKLTGKRGTCRLTGVAPSAGNFRGMRQAYAIKVR